MAASPKFKVYAGREYVAAFKYLADAAGFVAVRYARSGSVRLGHHAAFWHAPPDGCDSYDHAADLAAEAFAQRYPTHD